MSRSLYGPDLAYIHDRGFSRSAEAAAAAVIRLLRRRGIRRGLVVDLGCGGGRAASVLVRRGYDVLGLDRSPAMVRLAIERVPAARFRVADVGTAALPRCQAVVALGETLNYLGSRSTLRRLIRRVFRALVPGGFFICDLRELPRPAARSWIGARTGPDWTVVAWSQVAPRSGRLVRRIVSVRRIGGRWRRRQEVHRLRLYRTADVLGWFRSAGFRVTCRTEYGGRQYGGRVRPPGGRVVVARKPSGRSTGGRGRRPPAASGPRR